MFDMWMQRAQALQAMHDLCVWMWCNGLSHLEQWGAAEYIRGVEDR